MNTVQQAAISFQPVPDAMHASHHGSRSARQTHDSQHGTGSDFATLGSVHLSSSPLNTEEAPPATAAEALVLPGSASPAAALLTHESVSPANTESVRPSMSSSSGVPEVIQKHVIDLKGFYLFIKEYKAKKVYQIFYSKEYSRTSHSCSICFSNCFSCCRGYTTSYLYEDDAKATMETLMKRRSKSISEGSEIENEIDETTEIVRMLACKALGLTYALLVSDATVTIPPPDNHITHG